MLNEHEMVATGCKLFLTEYRKYLCLSRCPEKLREISHELKLEAKRLGLGLVGITSGRKSSRLEQYKRWLEKGCV